MKEFHTGIVIGISFSAERMDHAPAGQEVLKHLTGIPASQIAVKDNSFCLFHIKASVFTASVANSAVIDVP